MKIAKVLAEFVLLSLMIPTFVLALPFYGLAVLEERLVRSGYKETAQKEGLATVGDIVEEFNKLEAEFEEFNQSLRGGRKS